MSKTIREAYAPAMEITDQAEADKYFEQLVAECIEAEPMDRAEAEKIQRINLGYYAGYYNDATRSRVERLFKCAHPVFGAIAKNDAPSPERAFEAGLVMAQEKKS